MNNDTNESRNDYKNENGFAGNETSGEAARPAPAASEISDAQYLAQGIGGDRPQGCGDPQDRPRDFGASQDRPQNYDAPQDRPRDFGASQDRPQNYGDAQDRPRDFGASQDRPQNYGDAQDRPRDFGASQDRPQSYGDAPRDGAGAVNGEYRMARPDNSTTYFRPRQDGEQRRAEWTNSGEHFADGYNDRASYAPPRDPSFRPNANPYSAQGMNSYGHYRGGYVSERDAGAKTEAKKEKKGASAGVVAVICAVCVLLSGVCGFFGARLASTGKLFDFSASTTTVKKNGTVVEDNTTVIYRSVSTDAEAKETASVADVVNSVADSVVEITTEFRSTGYWQFIQSGAGSGVIISEDGYIATNNHVITNNGSVADAVKVRLRDGTEYDAKVIGRDADADVAVIKIEAEGLTAAVFGDSSKLVVGQDIVAIGNPLGELGGTVTEGIVSALDREVDVEGTKMNLLQISAAINPGNSGGGLFNMKGELVGIVNAKSSGSGIEGLGFAIPSNDASHIVEELIANGYVTGKPFLGITTYYCEDAFTAYRYFGSQATGLYIYETLKGYNEDVLKPGDRIIEMDGTEVVTRDDLVQILKNSKVGDTLSLVVYREGKRTEVEVKVYEYVPDKDDVSFES